MIIIRTYYTAGPGGRRVASGPRVRRAVDNITRLVANRRKRDVDGGRVNGWEVNIAATTSI